MSTDVLFERWAFFAALCFSHRVKCAANFPVIAKSGPAEVARGRRITRLPPLFHHMLEAFVVAQFKVDVTHRSVALSVGASRLTLLKLVVSKIDNWRIQI